MPKVIKSKSKTFSKQKSSSFRPSLIYSSIDSDNATSQKVRMIMKRIFDTKIITFCNHGHDLFTRFISCLSIWWGLCAVIWNTNSLTEKRRMAGYRDEKCWSWETQFMMSVIGNFRVGLSRFRLQVMKCLGGLVIFAHGYTSPTICWNCLLWKLKLVGAEWLFYVLQHKMRFVLCTWQLTTYEYISLPPKILFLTLKLVSSNLISATLTSFLFKDSN
jgi:hypothetical protein